MVTPEWKKTDGRLAARCAAVASFGAGVIHVAVVPAHWRDWVLSGLFFAVVALLQVIWAFFAWSRPTVPVLATGVFANAGLVALWVTACTSGAPFGPSAGQPEAANAAGIAVQLLQCYVVMGAAWAWFRGYQAEEVSGFNRALVLLGANTVMVGAVAIGVASTLQGHQHHHHGGASEVHADKHAEHVPPVGGRLEPPPSVEQGLPVTDMGLNTSGEPAPAPIAPIPAPIPAESTPAGDGHDHHHAG